MKAIEFVNKISMASDFDRIEFFSRGKQIGSLTKKEIQDGCIFSLAQRTINMFVVNDRIITIHLKPISE
ncbi:MAG: hypothetical protein IJI57_04295 [Flexilinea sp.]|nr:hypothetical protein [Flexilinea sp.]